MISLIGVAKHYGGRTLFSGVNVTIGIDERIGLVGPNGSGKTTVLEILAGGIEPDEGEVSRNKRATIGYLTQEVPRAGNRTLLDEMMAGHERVRRIRDRLDAVEEEMHEEEDSKRLEELAARHGELEREFDRAGGYDVPAEAKRILGGLAFRESDFGRPLDEFSGGWLMRLALARLLLTEPDLLLLDEPTNYLDLDSVIWLEKYLREYAGSMVIVSHDRVLLNRLSERILEIDRGAVTPYTGNYDAYVEAKRVRDEGLEVARKSQERKIAQTERFIERFRAKNTLAKRVQSRIKALEKIDRIEAPTRVRQIDFTFPDPPRAGRIPIELKGVAKAYGENRVYDGLEWKIERGERIVLVGANGAGKSTLLKILAGVLSVDRGERTLGHNVTIGYYAQHQVEALDYRRTILDEVMTATQGLTPQRVRTLLGRFLFSGEDVFKKIEVLSGGEKARVALAKLLLRPPNLLLLDEPTSHLDIPSRDVLAEALGEYAGSMVMISHDRHFIERLANRVDEVGSGGIHVYLGGYDDYMRRREAAGSGGAASPDGRARSAARGEDTLRKGGGRPKKTKEERRREAEERNARYRALTPLREEVGALEREIGELVSRLAGIETLMADRSFYEKGAGFAEIFRTFNELKAEIASKTERWEELGVRLEALERELG
ncbi:MAG: ABC-F family ATP-binding cassette domain-containing protein [Candidatus Eisenbacteria bacterium]